MNRRNSQVEEEEEEEENDNCPTLEQAFAYISQEYGGQVFCLQLANRLKVFPRAPDPRLVDEPCVRLNLFSRDGRLHCESYSYNRQLITRSLVTTLETDLGNKII